MHCSFMKMEGIGEKGHKIGYFLKISKMYDTLYEILQVQERTDVTEWSYPECQII